jgi:hypothetical protein
MFSVNVLFIFNHRLTINPPAFVQPFEKTTISSRVASNTANLLNLKNQRVTVAIQINVFNQLIMARGLALQP